MMFQIVRLCSVHNCLQWSKEMHENLFDNGEVGSVMILYIRRMSY